MELENLSRNELHNLAQARLNREFEDFKKDWSNNISIDRKNLFGWQAFDYVLMADIMFYFFGEEGEINNIIPDEQLASIINFDGNALELLKENARIAVTDRYEEYVLGSIAYDTIE